MVPTCKFFQAIISSTKGDLHPYRYVANEVLEQEGLHVLRMEGRAAGIQRDKDTPYSVQESLDLVQRSDLYVGILAYRYGTIPPGYAISNTELEYNRAEELGIPRLMFLIKDGTPWSHTADFADKGEQRERLEQFKARVQKVDGVEWFTSEDDFRARLTARVSRWLRECPPNALRAEDAKRLSSLSKMVTRNYADALEQWFADRFSMMSKHATTPALRTNDPAALDSAIMQVCAALEGINPRTEFRGGFYCLRDDGLVLAHHVPHFPKVNIRMKFNAFEREYFQRSIAARGPVVCNSFLSADRKNDIIVIAVPRYDVDGKWLGILDAVIDVSDAPFSDIISRLAGSFERDPETGRNFEVVLLDENAKVLGSLKEHRKGRSFDGHPDYHALRAGMSGPAAGYGCITEVAGTPFHVVTLWTQ